MKLSVSALLLSLASVIDFGNAETPFGQLVLERAHRREKMVAKSQTNHASLEQRQSNFKYMTNATSPYAVKSLPDVPYDVGEMYSGNIDIQAGNSSRTLFFVFSPKIGDPVEEVTIWLNGGPGCSSLEGFFQENGPFLWLPGTVEPVQNPYSWSNLTNMLWVEQPVGTGLTTGTPTASTEEEIAQDFISFFRNFQDLFGIKDYKIYITGESYAGRYVPYIGAAMLDANNTTYYNLSGALIYDPVIGPFTYLQQEYVAVPFATENNNILNLNDTFLSQMQEQHSSCGYATYLEEYFQFPASGLQPPVMSNVTNHTCRLFSEIDRALYRVNPCFDIYQIVQQCPLLSDVLNFAGGSNVMSYNTSYFNRTDVKTAMHAPLNVTWQECKGGVFVHGDQSADPIQHVLPQVIEATNRVLVGNGDFDMIIITNGTLLAIQNMTWNGQLGFQARPNTSIDIPYADDADYSVDAGYGVAGVQHYERGLMWVETYQSGHMQPEFQPRVAYRHLQWLLGQTDTI